MALEAQAAPGLPLGRNLDLGHTGRTVMEIDPNGRSAAEITALWTYVSERLEKNFRRTVFAVPQGPAVTSGAIARPAGGGFGRRVIGS